jgi:hypothetical protein
MQARFLAIGFVVGMLALSPSALAVHGSAYRAYGVATSPNAPGVFYNAEVDWTGFYGLDGYPAWGFEVKIDDMTTGLPVTPHTFFFGQETEQGRAYGNTEVFLYRGWASNPAINFQILGIQSITITDASQKMVYQGNYDDFQLLLVVDGTP